LGQAHKLTTLQLIALLAFAAVTGAFAALLGLRGAPTPAEAAITHRADPPGGTSDTKPTEKKKMGCPVVHFEIGCRDNAKTRDFYTKLFDWQMSGATSMATNIETAAGKGIDGHITTLGHDPEHYVTVYVQVDNIKTYLDRVTALGGKMIVPSIAIPTGHFAWISDPDGNIIGLLQPKKP